MTIKTLFCLNYCLFNNSQEGPPHHELHTQDRPTAHRRTGGGINKDHLQRQRQQSSSCQNWQD